MQEHGMSMAETDLLFSKYDEDNNNKLEKEELKNFFDNVDHDSKCCCDTVSGRIKIIVC